MSECRFDLKPLRCTKCGAYMGELGTCDDVAYCGKCDGGGLEPWRHDDMTIGVDVVHQRDEGGKTRRLRIHLHQINDNEAEHKRNWRKRQ